MSTRSTAPALPRPDACRGVWDALTARGAEPHGQPFAFRAKCPVHEGTNADALAVREGVDRRVLLHCHAHGCAAEEIVEALNLSMSDLFAAGHRQAHRVRHEPVVRSNLGAQAQAVANTLAALDELDRFWWLTLGCDCPYCGEPGGWLRTLSDGKPTFTCAHGCSAEMTTGALAALLLGIQGG